MCQRWQKRMLGLIVGVILGVVLVIGGTNGASGESSELRRSEQFFFWIPLYNLSGPHDEVKAVEHWWAVRLYTAGAIIGGIAGFAVAYRLTRKR